MEQDSKDLKTFLIMMINLKSVNLEKYNWNKKFIESQLDYLELLLFLRKINFISGGSLVNIT